MGPHAAAIKSAPTIKTAATAKVMRMPVATASGGAEAMSTAPDANANTAPIAEP